MISLYHFMCFTPFVPDIPTRGLIGYSLSGILVIYLLVNLAKVIITNIKGAIKWWKNRKYHAESVKRIAERQLERTKKLNGNQSYETWRQFRSGVKPKLENSARSKKDKE